MRKIQLFTMAMAMAIALITMFISCNKDDDSKKPTLGTIEGTVVDAEDNSNLSGVKITVFDANTNFPTNATMETDAKGEYKFELDPGTYFLKLNKLGYNSIPGQGITSIPITVVAGETTTSNFEMTPSLVQDGSIISGKVSTGNEPVTGTLIIAESLEAAYSAISDAEGNYYIYNVPAGSYSIKAWITGYNSSTVDITVEASSENNDVNLELTNDANATVSGRIDFLATENTEVDVSLVHPVTKETIPGLATFTVDGNYTIENVPNGTYLGRASFENDNNVIDPDWIVKFGEPYITVDGSDILLNFSVTNAVTLISPTNDSISVQPIEVSIDTLNFMWESYPSASDYVIEVMNANGTVIWGGFANNWSAKNVTIPSSETSAEFNFDETALSELVIGNVYRWRIYASKNDKQSATGWKLISVSEDQRGLIKIVE